MRRGETSHGPPHQVPSGRQLRATTGGRSRPSTHAVVLIGRRLRAGILRCVTTELGWLGAEIHAVRKLADCPVTAWELLISAPGDLATTSVRVRDVLRAVLAEDEVDVAVESVGPRRHATRMVVFDVDCTLLRGEVIDMLAARAGREREVGEITQAAMRGEIDFTASLHRRVAALAGLPAMVLDEVAEQAELTPGVRTTVQALRELGFPCGAISGGFSQVVQPIAAELGLDFFAANELEVEDGRLTGRVVGDVIDQRAKAAALRRFASCYGVPLTRCVAVGDGANDIDMLTTAGLGVAFNAKPALREVADVALSYHYMDALLFVLGISADESAAARNAAVELELPMAVSW
ncbi:MAG: phosphoserine phosphatase SerB [Pseudonocardiaceae bacterium]